jgi:VIT1/CCC1 family predicted Fe2+/Mn2+ transporter
MKHAIKKGFSFGLTSGIITTLGVIVGLNATTASRDVVIGGILIIALADAMSDAMGMHISEEAEHVHTEEEIWVATLSTFLAKFLVAITFIIPFLLLPCSSAIFSSIVWGLSLIVIFSIYLSIKQKVSPYKVVVEHLAIAIFVIIATQLIGHWVRNLNL